MIRLDHVTRKWPEFSIRDVTLEVKRGEYLVIVGPTGAGKTLLLELLLGIHRPDQGEIFVNGKNITGLPPEKRAIGMVYQDYVLFPHLNVERNLAFGLRYKKWTQEKRTRNVEEVSKLLGIEHLLHRYPNTLSGGEKQRVAIGRALVTEPPVLLLDEPLSALDLQTSRRLRAELKSLHNSRQLTVVHVTHDLSEARQMGGPIALINEGRLNAFGTAAELLRRPPTLFAANFVGAVNVYKATPESYRDGMRLVAGPISVATAQKDNGTSHLMIFPDEIILMPGGGAIDEPNCLRGSVTGLTDEGNYIAVSLQVEGLAGPLTAYISRHAVRAQSLELGADVIADVRNAIHVLSE